MMALLEDLMLLDSLMLERVAAGGSTLLVGAGDEARDTC